MSQSCLLSLPSELLENVIVSCVENIDTNGDTLTHPIAALAQTCQQLRTLIYNAVDNHLWRSLFLAAFDDPRRHDTSVSGKL